MKISKAKYNWLVAQYNYRKNKEQLIEISDEEYQRLTRKIIPQGPTGETEPTGATEATGNTEPQGPTGNTEPQEYNYEDCDFGINGIGYKVLSLDEQTVQACRLFKHDNIIIPDEVIYNNVIFKVTECNIDYCSTIKFNKYINLNNSSYIINIFTNYFYVDDLNPYMTCLDGNIYNKDLTKLLCIKKIIDYKGNFKLMENFIIPDFVTDIKCSFSCVKNVYFNDSIINLPDDIFYGNNSTEYIKLSNKIKVLPNSIFSSCTKLKKIILPQELEQILTGYWNYYLPNSIENITVYNSNIINYTYTKHLQSFSDGKLIQESYENTNVYVFNKLQNLKTLYVLDENPVPLNENIFTDGKYFTVKVYVPKGCKTIYENTEGWNKFYNIIEVEE